MNINWKEWIKAAGIRALRTFGQSAIAYIGTGAMVLGDVNWLGVLSAGALGAVMSILMALATGLPEVEPDAKPDNGKTEPVKEDGKAEPAKEDDTRKEEEQNE